MTAPSNGLVIGAMKSGTTTMFHDFSRMPEFSLPAKEMNFFQRPADQVTRASYDRLFEEHERDAGLDQVSCRLDISTTYTFWPDVPDVPRRAAEVLEGEAKLVYLVRNPIERAVSHHHHMVARGATDVSFEDYLGIEPGLIGYGRYELQAQQWEAEFGQEALLVVRLDDYSANWRETVRIILAHLGVDHDVSLLDPPAKENVTDEARVFTGKTRQLAESPLWGSLYRNGVRRLVPDSLRTKLRNAILPAPPERPSMPADDVLTGLVEVFQPTVAFVAERTGTEPWDLAETADQLALAK